MKDISNKTFATDEESGISFAPSEPRHYDRIPSIIDHLTYIEEGTDPKTGEKIFVRKRLTPIDKELYRILRYRAGAGVCWRTTEDLAAHVGCSKNSITESKRNLEMPFEQLEGNPLIHIEKTMVATTVNGHCINKRPVHRIHITDIWRFNNAFMDKITEHNKRRQFQRMLNDQAELNGQAPSHVDDEIEFPKREEVLSHREAELAIEKMRQPGIVSTVHNLGAIPNKGKRQEAHPFGGKSSTESNSQIRDVNKEHRNKDHCRETNTTANAVSRCFFETEDVEECFSSQARALSALQTFGLSLKVASSLVKEYSLDALLLCAIYVRQRIKKDKVKNTITGYYLQALKNKWYINYGE